jgi:nucleotide-binding universal stress UspA family protein
MHFLYEGMRMFNHILVPTEGEKLSFKALEMAMSIAEVHHAKLTVIIAAPAYPPVYAGDGYVFDPISSIEWNNLIKNKAAQIKEKIDQQVAKFNAKHAEGDKVVVNFYSVADDSPYLAIIATAKSKRCDLIVMASHGRRGLSALLLGSETSKVLTHSTLPVLVCR